MRLTKDIKRKIDNYFNSISSEELYDLAISKYGFEEITIDIESQSFAVIEQKFYTSVIDNSIEIINADDIMPLATAA